MIATERDFLNDNWEKHTYSGISSYHKYPYPYLDFTIYGPYEPDFITRILNKFFHKPLQYKVWKIKMTWHDYEINAEFDSMEELKNILTEWKQRNLY